MKNLVLALATMVFICSNSAALSQTADLYTQQLNQPNSKLNIGIQYWIELHRGKEIIQTNHKAVFKSGDRIRFHVKPNIDGYAYILLTSGSDGQRAQLFPSAETSKDNRIHRGKDIVLPPPDAVLKFDNTPGTEKLSLIISRNSINPHEYLESSKAHKNVSKQSNERKESKEVIHADVTKIAMNTAGSRDLFPDNASVAYVTPSDLEPPKATPHKTKRVDNNPTKQGNSESSSTVVAQSHGQKSREEKMQKVEEKKNSVPIKDESISSESKGLVTVVCRNPKGVLHCDITLKHI